MTFFEIFNKVLLELNYRTISAFEDIYKNEHLKILNAINRVNDEVLSTYEWPFLLKKADFTAEDFNLDIDNAEFTGINSQKDTTSKDFEIQNEILTQDENQGENIPVTRALFALKGRVKSVYRNTKRLLYDSDFENAFQKGISADKFTLYETPERFEIIVSDAKGKLKTLKPKQTAQKEETIALNSRLNKDYTVYYYSNNYALKANGEFCTKMSDGDDTSILPMPWREHILLYGTCLKVKGNPAYPKFGFWNTMYIQALANLRQKSPSAAGDEPFIKIL